MRISQTGLAAVLCVAAFAVGGSAFAEEKHFTAELAAPSGVTSDGTGTADITYDTDTKEMTWTIEFSGLTGPATAAHFHGPAAEGENAGVQVPIEGTESPLEGSATLTDEQAGYLMDGMLYVNVHTEANGGGEIRGQVTEGMM